MTPMKVARNRATTTSVVPGKARARESAIVAPTRDPYAAAAVMCELLTARLPRTAPLGVWVPAQGRDDSGGCRWWSRKTRLFRQRALLQRQKHVRDRLMLRYLREEAQPLAIDRKVAGFFATGGKPVAIQVERGGLQIVGVADDPQHGAASARDLAGFDQLAISCDRLVGPDAKVDAVIGRCGRAPLGAPDSEGRVRARVQAGGLAPGDEALDR